MVAPLWKNKASFDKSVDVNTAWLSTLARPGTCIAQESTGSLVLVVVCAEYSFLAWDLSVEAHSGQRVFLCKTKRNCIMWRHIVKLDEWKVLPVEPLLISPHQGPVGWQKSGPFSLPSSRACSLKTSVRTNPESMSSSFLGLAS